MTAKDIGSWFRKALSIQVLIAFLLGLIIGLVVFGWGVWPVQWTDADPSDLVSNEQDAYLQLVAEAYALTGNTQFAQERLQALKKPEQTDADLSVMIEAAAQTRSQAGKAEDAIRLQRLATALNLPAAAITPEPSPEPTSEPTQSGGSSALRFLGIVFFLALLAGGVIVLLTQLQKKEPRRKRATPATPETSTPVEDEPAVQTLPMEGASVAQFVSEYNAGDEAYDVSYGIESASGEFLGECGISALDRTLGEPGRFAAFDIWLFDKLEAHTETRLLLSEGVAADAVLSAKLPDRGQPVQAEKDKVITLETENLRMIATITGLDYDDASSTIFSRLATRLEVLPKTQES